MSSRAPGRASTTPRSTTPAHQWEIGIFGNTEVDGTGVAPKPAARQSVLLDFLPSFERTVQQNGVTIDDRPYYDTPLQHWIGATDPESGEKRKFIFRRDPRDISSVWFFDPDLEQYFKIPFAERELPAISLWEYRQVRERLAAEGRKSVNEIELLHAITEQRGRIDESTAKTKRARRQAQRRAEHEKKAPHLQVVPAPEGTPAAAAPLDDLLDEDVEDFRDFA